MGKNAGQGSDDGFPRLTLVLGGVSSGKTKFAERLIEKGKGQPVYIATAEPIDDEMRRKIERHQKSRGSSWRTIDAPFDVASALAECSPGDTALIDGTAVWLSNHVHANKDAAVACDELLKALEHADFPIVVVSDEIGLGGIADNSLTRLFVQLHGELNQQLAARAEFAIVVHAGLPLVLKGEMPK